MPIFKWKQRVPLNLSTSSDLTFPENSKVETVIGNFTAEDPDGHSITYHLVDGLGSENNSLFNLDSEGTLKTAYVFDYESNASSFSIRVQARDEYNGTIEGNFTIQLEDMPDQLEDIPDLVYDASTLDSKLKEFRDEGRSDVLVVGPSDNNLVIDYSPNIPSDLNVTFYSYHDLHISKPFSYAGEQTITLSAGGSIFVQAPIFASHTNGKFAAHYGLSEPSWDNHHFFIVAQPVNLEMGENFFSQQGYDGQQNTYQVIHHLGEQNSSTGIDLQGMKSNPNINFALGRDIDAGETQTWREGNFTNEIMGVDVTFIEDLNV